MAARFWTTLIILFGCSMLGVPWAVTADPPAKEPEESAETPAEEWLSLFDGESLTGWKSSDFGGDGEIRTEEGQLILAQGVSLTGVTWEGDPLPVWDYEVSLEARRVDGSDFFCGLTFPVGDDPCSLIVGGWGGSTVGLSSLDGFDASENASTTYQTFKKGTWYPIRLQVTHAKIQAWIDDKQVVDIELADRRISIRPEVDRSRPFGISSWCTTAALKNIKLRKLGKETVAE